MPSTRLDDSVDSTTATVRKVSSTWGVTTIEFFLPSVLTEGTERRPVLGCEPQALQE